MFNITSKYCSIFNNKPPASWVAHITRDFLTCYSCLYYSSILKMKKHFFWKTYKIFCLKELSGAINWGHLGGNYLKGNHPGAIIRGTIIQAPITRGSILLGVIVQGVIIVRENCPGEICHICTYEVKLSLVTVHR